MAFHMSRQIGEECNIRRVLPGVHVKSTHQEGGAGHSEYTPERDFTGGGGGSAFQEGNLQDLPSFPRRFLVNLLPSFQENGRFSESKTTQLVHQTKEIQNGLPVSGSESSYQRSLGYFHRPEGCLSSYPNPPITSTVASIQDQWSGLCFQSAPLWPFYSSQSIYLGGKGSGCFPPPSGSPDPSIFGQLVDNISDPRDGSSSYRIGTQDSLQVGVCGKLREVQPSPYPITHFPGSQIGYCSRESIPFSREWRI